MNSFLRRIRGEECIILTGAAPYLCLNRFTSAGLTFRDPETVSEFSVQVTILAKDRQRAELLAELAQCEFGVLKRTGILWCFAGLLKRVPFLALLCFTVVFTFVLQNRIWFISVEGNYLVPDQEILRAAASCGAGIGVRGKDIVPQKIKDRVLAQIPALSWLTVRQNGCRAVISVREKESIREPDDRREISNVEAVCPGVIEEISVLDGSAACKVGDVVEKGDVLISAYVDLEYKIRAAGARGEVFARTWHTEIVHIPLEYRKKMPTEKEITISYLCFGKKSIKLSRSSGIPHGACDKITQTSPLKLPGGLCLPVTLVRETYRFYDSSFALISEEQARAIVSAYAVRHVSDQMAAGEILTSDFSHVCDGAVLSLRAELTCREMIGRRVKAEIFKED